MSRVLCPSFARVVLSLALLVLFAVARPVGAAPLDRECMASNLPAATLLFPYFEVDLDSPGGLTTLISIGNASDFDPALVRVTVWTEWAIPSVSFDLFLEARDIQTLNLRDLFATGDAPVTGGPGLSAYPSCGSTVGGHVQLAEALQRSHTGRSIEGFCLSVERPGGSSIARGYVTADVTRRCSTSSINPSRAGYFDGPEPVADTRNVLWGDFFLVDPGENLAQGQTAVALWADPGRYRAGDSTFYGRYVGWSGVDGRVPLSSEWRVRFAIGSIFDDTELIVWRDTESPSASPVTCGETPDWYPLTVTDTEYWSEDASGPGVDESLAIFGFATQRVSMKNRVDPVFDFGWVDLDLDEHADFGRDARPNQGWVMWMVKADGRFSVGQEGVRMNELCRADPP